MPSGQLPARQAAWSVKGQVTCSETLACRRRSPWRNALVPLWPPQAERRNIPCAVFEPVLDRLCDAA
jgi:hypothetical protein